MSIIKLEIDVKTGSICVEADSESFDGVMERAESLLDKFKKVESSQSSANNTHQQSAPQTQKNEDSTSHLDTNGIPINDDKPKAKRRRAGGGKTANWKMVDDLLDETGRQELNSFFEQKAPKNQNEQVAVLIVKLKELTNRDRFDGNDLHTAFQIVGKKTPANLTAVFGNMTGFGFGKSEDKKFVPNFKCDDFVKYDLPKVKK